MTVYVAQMTEINSSLSMSVDYNRLTNYIQTYEGPKPLKLANIILLAQEISFNPAYSWKSQLDNADENPSL